ncbi:MAG: D-glycero-beta-D-manno-heptose-7-phosphate kinase [bacterium]
MSRIQEKAKTASRPLTRRLLQWPQRFKDARVLVVGDLIVDEFIWGKVERISPEAPVPVVKVTEKSLRWGGAANVANNLRAMGAKVSLVGIVGADQPGRWLLRDVRKKGVNTEGIFLDPARPSTLKTRIIAHSQQVVRIDNEKSGSLSQELGQKLRDFIRRQSSCVDAIIVSDYGKGVVDEPLMEEVRMAMSLRGIIACVDPKVSPFTIYRQVTAVTPNYKEAVRAAGVNEGASVCLEQIGQSLIKELQCRMLLITRGEEGMSLFLDGAPQVHIPTVAKKVYDVTGAGDTVISVFTLGLVSGAPPKDAAIMANLAAGVVVGEMGTATVGQKKFMRVLKQALRIT